MLGSRTAFSIVRTPVLPYLVSCSAHSLISFVLIYPGRHFLFSAEIERGWQESRVSRLHFLLIIRRKTRRVLRMLSHIETYGTILYQYHQWRWTTNEIKNLCINLRKNRNEVSKSIFKSAPVFKVTRWAYLHKLCKCNPEVSWDCFGHFHSIMNCLHDEIMKTRHQ